MVIYKLSYMLDVRRLRLLRELHARGTVTAVAEALAYTPSAVSQQLATLEREAGVPLMERHGRRLRLTDAGRGLVEHAEVVIARLELAEAELAAAPGDEVAGRVRIAAFQTAASSLVLPLLGTLRAEHPRLRLELVEMEAEEALALLPRGEIDIASPRSTTTRRARATRRCRSATSAATRSCSCCPPTTRCAPPTRRRSRSPRSRASSGPRRARARRSTTRSCAPAARSAASSPTAATAPTTSRVLEQLVAAGEAVALMPSLGRPGRVPGVAVRRVGRGAAGPPDLPRRPPRQHGPPGAQGRRRGRCATRPRRSGCPAPLAEVARRAWPRACRTPRARPRRRTGTGACGRAPRPRA